MCPSHEGVSPARRAVEIWPFVGIVDPRVVAGPYQATSCGQSASEEDRMDLPSPEVALAGLEDVLAIHEDHHASLWVGPSRGHPAPVA